MLRLLTTSVALLAVGACAQPPTPTTADPSEAVLTVETEAGPVAVFEVQADLEHPWGIAFLPDGRALVTERAGRLRIVDGSGEAPMVAGTPETFVDNQGGLLDVALAPDFAETGFVYLTYAKPGPSGMGATAVGRGRFENDALVGFEELWAQEPYQAGGRHFGSRIAFTPDGYLLVSTGDRGQGSPAQELGNTIGTIVRLTMDGGVPEDNPFVGDADARPEIWAYGIRNGQSLGVHPETGDVWEAEFGPKGGDELNLITPGTNYGWPLVSWGTEYNNAPIPDPPTRPEFTDAVRQWTPVISPSGLLFYTADAFPEWTGSLMLGSLGRQGIVRLTLDGQTVTGEETIELGQRIRDVEQGPDGSVYVLIDAPDGSVWRLEPAAGGQ